MAKNIFGFGAMGVRPEMAAAPEDPREKRAKIEGIASRLQVPANVLLAMDEAGERDIEGAAGRISQAAQAGKRLEEIVPGAVLSRAYDIADQLYPRQAPVKPVANGGLAAAFGSGIDSMQQAFGSAIEGAGRATGIDAVEKFGAGIAERNAREAEEGSAGLTQLSDVDGIGSAAKYAGEVVAQNAPQMGLSIAGGWAGASAGATAGAAVGSVIPILGTAAGGVIGGVIGGLAGGMTVNVPLIYGQHRERHKDAIDRGIRTEVDEGAAFLAALPAAALDSIVDRFLVGKFLKPEVLNAGGILTRAVRSGAAGAVVEVPTEIGQQIIERAQAGLPLDDDEAIAEYTAAGVAAGILGGSVGAASGALSSDTRNMNPGEGDGSADAGQNAEGIATPESVPSAFAETGGEPPAQPEGPISQIAASVPDMTPVPDAPQMFPDQKPGAPVRLRDPETGAILEGVFQREEGGNAIVRLGGEEVDIAPQLFDEMLGEARKADLAAEAAAKGGKGAAQDALIEPQEPADPVVAQSDAQPKAGDPGSVSGAVTPTTQQSAPIAPGGLAEVAVKASPVAARPKDDPLKDLTPEQAAVRLKNVEERIRSAKTPRKSLIDLRDRLTAIVAGGVETTEGGGNVEIQSRIQPVVGDVGTPGGGNAGEVGGTDADRSQRDPQRAVQGGADPAPVLSGSREGVADATPSPEPDEALTARERRPLKGTPPNPPTSVEPIKTAPADRIQPDMLGGAPVNEDQMAAKERTRREWGRVLGIAAGNSASDEVLEGRDVLIRPGKIVIRAKPGERSDLDYRIDTDGMDRDEIAARLRGALGELDRVAPLTPVDAAAAPSPAATAIAQAAPEAPPAASAAPLIEDLRERAAVLRGVPKEAPPAVPGVSLKWDEKAGGFIFSRKHADKVRDAVMPKPAQNKRIDIWAPVTRDEAKALGEQWDAMSREDRAKLSMDGGSSEYAAKSVAARRWDEIGDTAKIPLANSLKARPAATASEPAALPIMDARKEDKKRQAREAGQAAARAGQERNVPGWAVGTEFANEWLAGYADEKAKGTPADQSAAPLSPQPAGPRRFDWWWTNNRDQRREALKNAGLDTTIYTGLTSGEVADRLTGEQMEKLRAAIFGPESEPKGNGAVEKAKDKMMRLRREKPGSPELKQAEADLRKARQDAFSEDEKPVAAGWRQIGTNVRGEALFEDERGVRSFIDKDEGVRSSEPVRMVPGRDGTKQISIDKDRRNRDYLTQDEWDAKQAKAETGPTPQKIEAIDPAPFEAVGMVKGKATTEDAWFRKQAEPGGVASYKAKSVPGGWRLTRDFVPNGDTTMPPTRQLGTVATTADAIAQLRENGMRTGVPEEASPAPATKPAPKADPAPKPAAGILGVLSQEKQNRAEELKAKLAAKARTQVSSGLDPEYITLGGELVALYMEAGIKKFGLMLRDFAESTGLTMREAQAPMRAAYNHVRDTMDLDGKDVSDMDDAAAVMAEVRKAMAEEEAAQSGVQSQKKSGKVDVETSPETSQDDNRTDDGDGGTGAKESAQNSGSRQGQIGSLRSDDRATGRSGDRRAERAGERPVARSDGSGNGDGAGAGNRTGGRAGTGAANHVIEPGGLDLARGEKTRARESIAAIRTLRTLQSEGRPATAEERATLAKYGGAGTLAGTLPRSDGTIKFPELAAEIESMTTPEERATLSRTSQYAFYTAESALRSMWSLAEQLGFKGGRVYEPGMGVGGFAGTMPQSLDATYTGLELDHLTAQIAGALYPKHRIKNGDFIKEKLPQGFYDLVIGNPPFAGTKIQADPDYPQGFFIHDYFFAKSLDAVRPGGLLMFITSAGTMNKMDSKARDYLADRADLVGAIRLPNTAFKENGTEVTTDIIVLRKRLEGEAEANPGWRTSEVIDLPRDDGTTGQAAVNGYFVANPDMILGEQGLYDTLTAGERVGVRPKPDSDLRKDLQAILTKFPTNIMSEPPASVALDALDADHAETKPGSFYLKDGELYQFDGNTGRKVEARSRENTKGMPKAAMEAIKALIPIKNALRDVYSADVDGKDATAARKALNEAYDAYVKERGPIGLQNRREQRPSVVEQEGARQQAYNDARAAGYDFDIGSFDAGPMIEAGASMGEIARARQAAREAGDYREGDFDPASMPNKVIVTRPNIDPFMDDPESYRLLAIEKYDDKTDTAAKSRVFTENAVRLTSKPKINSPEDALLHLLGETGEVQPERIAALAGSTVERVIKELEGKIFLNPVTREWETKARYLSGNVVEKLEAAERESRTNPEYEANVDALRAVQPEPITSNEIAVPLGAHWFPTSVYSDFARSLGLDLTAEFKPRLGIWLVGGSTTGSTATSEWGTPDRPFADLMQLVMTNKPIEVKRSRKNSDGSTETWVDQEATQAATDKAKELQDRFKQWFWEDEDRTAKMEAIYNRTFNAEVAPQYDGSYLTTPGIHSDWSWRPHQTAVIARILQSGDTYMAHTVGAGKTSAMIGAGMEAKRLGLAKKPWYVVPNHMLIQFTTEFYQQYPLAKILVADDRRFHTSKRKQFVADAALGDYDAVIITHSAFHLIPPSEASKKMTVEGMLQDVRDVLEGLEGGAFGEDAGMERSVLGALNSMAATLGVDVKGLTEGKTKTRKKIEALLEAAEQRISRQTSDEGKDAVFNFDETGADMLFVDEAHLFRKLSFATSLGNIKGIDPQGSQASMDLFIKTRGLAQRNPGRSLVLASGTPITNTMAELYSISRYLQPQALEDRNISAFDSWAATFGQTESALEQDPAGGYKTVTRFSKFVNTPELSLMVRQVMDVVSGPDLEKYVTRPALKGGKRTLVVVEPSPELKAYQKTLAERMKAIENRKGPVKKGDDILLSVINDGRLAAIDLRLVDPDAGDTGSKLDQMVQAIYRRWKDGANAPLYGVKKEGGYTDRPVEHGPTTQIVFSTLGVNPTKHNPTFSVHRYIKAQLVSMGVPADEIILSENLNSDARKQRAFMDMNEGKKRILIGSKTLFTGVNAQRRITAIHNLDPLWFPADDEQRNGRGIRQGNMNREIEILDYSAKGTYDATMWQMMGRKAGFIEGFFRGDPSMRDMDDLGEASQYEQAKAMSTADPRVLQLTELRAERDKLARRAGAAIGQRKRMEATIRGINRSIDIEREELAFWEGQAAKVQDTQGDKFEARAGGKAYIERKEFGAYLISAAEDALAGDGFKSGDRAAMISGFPVHIGVWQASGTAVYYIPLAGDRDVNIGWSDDPVGMARKVEGALSTIKGAPTRIAQTIRKKEAELADTKAGLAKLKDFAEQDKLNALQDQVDALESELLAEADGEEKQSRMGGIAATPANLRTVAASVAAELKDHGLGDAVKVRTVRGLLSATGMPVQGTYRAGEIGVNADAVNPLHTARHEIVHALRDANLWGRDYGLFTQEEWRALVKAARDDKGIRKAVEEAYPDLTSNAQTEEMVAELYAYWATDRSENPLGALGAALERIRSLFRAMASALRGEGFVDAARVMERMANGEIGGRGPDGPGGGTKASGNEAVKEMRAPLGAVRAKFAPLIGDRGWRDTPAMFSEWLSGKITDNMAGDKASFLGLIPGRALFSELGKGMLSARRYLRVKEEMDTVRDEWHADAAAIAQKWIDMQKRNPSANEALMDLMHRSTLTGVDPSQPDQWGKNDNLLKAARGEWSRLGQNAPAWARQKIADFEARQKTYAATKELFDALPPEFQSFYVEVKKAYEAMADDFDRALEDNIKSAAKIALKRAEKAHRKEMRRIEDDGLTGAERAEAIEAADKELAKAKKRAQMGVNTKIKSLRKVFEGQRVKGPYFPLARFGNFWAVVRDADGKVINFSRFENSAQQRAFMREQEEIHPGRVRGGLLEDKAALRDQVDPKFVADIEAMLSDTGASPDLMDAIWQRYLETLPDQSIRTSKIHRKGRAGFSRDALRSFTSHMFHGAHQLARLRFGLDLGDALDDAADEAKIAKDPNRAMAIVNEMRRRMAWTMAPTNAPWVAAASSMAFVWYLGVSPAAALVNITQTTVIGPAVMKARFKGASVSGILSELGRASGDFVKGRGKSLGETWSAENSPDITKEELAALREAHRRGTIDRTQSHDLASVQESGIEFNPVREKIMRKIGWAFHHAERFNREVTFLANYRLARKDGQAHEDAIETAADLTWKIHFSYQNSDRPRAMQGDWPKLFLQFRQFTFNLLYRLFRDVHQSLHGATEADRKEARTQLVGISLSMMAHAGIKGVWGYSIIMGLLALFFPGDADDLEEWMQDALLMEGDSAGVAAWNFAMGAALNGAPGQLAGVSLTERIGSPNLWFRGPDRTLEGEDWLQSYVNELLGPSVGIAFSLARGAQNFADGDEVRGVEAITPKFIRDIIKTGRYALDGVNTKNGDPLIENVNPWELFMQLNGFTPARVAERYEINSRLKNLEKEIIDERQSLHRRAGDALRAGEPIPEKVMDMIRDFNARFPEYPITGDTLRQSIRSRERASERNEFGISLNPKINDRLREGLAPSLYG